jgi:hypothetical protein
MISYRPNSRPVSQAKIARRKARAGASLIEPNGRPHIECLRCGVLVVWPEALSPDAASEMARTCRVSRVEGARYAHDRLGLGLREAKALSLHVTFEPNRCHWCGSHIDEVATICSQCSSANLDW